MGVLERRVLPTFGQRYGVDRAASGLEQQSILEQMSRVRAYCKDAYDPARVTGRTVNNPLGGGSQIPLQRQSQKLRPRLSRRAARPSA